MAKLVMNKPDAAISFFFIRNKTFLLIVLLCCFSIISFSKNINDQQVSISFQNISIEKALRLLEIETGYTFSYNPIEIPVDNIISITIENQKLPNALTAIIGNPVSLKQIKNIVIIKITDSEQIRKSKISIKGQVIDGTTGRTIGQTSVLVVGSKYAEITNEDGLFEIDLKSTEKYHELYICKRFYKDTVIIVPTAKPELPPILLAREEPDPTPLSKKEATLQGISDIEELSSVRMMVPDKQLAIAYNFEDYYEEGPFQMSLFPFLSTNLKMNATKVSNISVNIFAGFSGAVDGVEVGGFLNIIRKDVKGTQIAGFSNITGGKVDGVQVAGFGNNSRHKVTGAQVSGFYNMVLDTLQGVQASGFFNLAKGHTTGIQLAGFSNVATGEFSGLQASPYVNVTTGKFYGSKITGFLNFSKDTTEGVLASGFMNVSHGTTKGVQAASFANYSQDMVGIQGSTFFNYARKVKGIQIGFINYADTVEGVSIGFISIVKKGYRAFEFEHSDLHELNFKFKLGVRNFFNTFSIGSVNMFQHHKNLSFGYGIGVLMGKKEKKLNYTLECYEYVIVNTTNDQVNNAEGIDFSFDYKLAKWLTLYAGPTIRLLRFETKDNNSTYLPTYFELSNNTQSIKLGLGFRCGLRL